MDLYTAYSAVNKSVLNVAKSVNAIKEPSMEKPKVYTRIKENPVVLTEDTRLTCQIVTAHDLQQYRNTFHNVKLRENVGSWLRNLLSIDKTEDEL